MELETLRSDYIELVKASRTQTSKCEQYMETILDLKERNTRLCMAIVNIPEPDYKKKAGEEDKRRCKLTLSIKKAKQLAQKGGDQTLVNNTATAATTPLTPEKKRKAEDVEGPRPKRVYKKRASLSSAVTAPSQEILSTMSKIVVVTTEKSKDAEIDVLSANTTGSSQEEEEDDMVEEINLAETTRSLLNTWPAESDPAKVSFTISDSF